jgi:hypothetical protein
MDKQHLKKLEKIFNKIGRIAAKGKDYYQEYSNYVEELVDKGDYGYFVEVMDLYFSMYLLDEADLSVVKKKTWKEILFQTKSSFLQKLSRLYKQKKIYQQSINIYSDDINITQTSLSDKYSVTYSVTGLTPSLNVYRTDGNIFVQVLDNTIDYIDIEKATWQTISGIYQPTQKTFIQDFYVSYNANSYTDINIDNLYVGFSFTMSVTPQKAYQQYQLVGLTSSDSYITGNVINYDMYSGDLNIEVQSFTGSGTNSVWIVEYISGTQSPIYRTEISTDFASEYVIGTTNVYDDEKYFYKFTIYKDPFIGTIEEIDTFNPGLQYLNLNKQYAQLLGQRKYFLKVTKASATQSVAVIYDNESYSEETNLIERYRLAINYLLS